jgi:hypothetical protein
MYVMDTEHVMELNSTCRLDEEAGYMDHMVKETSVLFTQYCSGDKIKKNKMGGACSTYGEEEGCIQGFGGET